MRWPFAIAIVILGCDSRSGVEPSPDGTLPDDGTTKPPCAGLGATPHVRLCSVTRAPQNPLLSPATHPGISNNITMPSVIRAPDALAAAAGFGPYWMYFAAHDGHYIRLAHASAVTGPWTTYAPGSL